MGHVAYLHECGGGGLQTSDGAALWNVMSVTEEGMHADCWDQVFTDIVSISRSLLFSPTLLAAARRHASVCWHQTTGLGPQVSKADGCTAWTRTKRGMDRNEVAASRRGLSV